MYSPGQLVIARGLTDHEIAIHVLVQVSTDHAPLLFLNGVLSPILTKKRTEFYPLEIRHDNGNSTLQIFIDDYIYYNIYIYLIYYIIYIIYIYNIYILYYIERIARLAAGTCPIFRDPR